MSTYEEIRQLVNRAIPGHWSDVSDYECRKLLPVLLKALELACEDGNMSATPEYWIEQAENANKSSD